MQKKETDKQNSLFLQPQYFLLGFFIISAFLTSLFVWRMPPQIPIFLSRPAGGRQLASAWWLLIIPIFHLILYISSKTINKFISEDGVLKNMFLWMELSTGSFLLLALFYIIFLVY